MQREDCPPIKSKVVKIVFRGEGAWSKAGRLPPKRKGERGRANIGGERRRGGDDAKAHQREGCSGKRMTKMRAAETLSTHKTRCRWARFGCTLVDTRGELS